jgi:DNA oxidative demethylase
MPPHLCLKTAQMASELLFAELEREVPLQDVVLLRGFVTRHAPSFNLHAIIRALTAVSPFRSPVTKFGPMSVGLTNCGDYGWIADEKGYRYTREDPLTRAPWPALPGALLAVADAAAQAAGFGTFVPDACILNQYAPGAKMGSHQDRDERDFSHPIVSLSFGLSARFFIRSSVPSAKPVSFPLHHGDALVWGRSARLAHHGIRPLARGDYPAIGALRYNFTLRKAG